MKLVNTQNAPAPSGHYSHAAISNGFIFLAGQTPKQLGTDEIPEGAAAQTEQIMDNIEAVLTEVGANLSDIVKMNVYVTRIAEWGTVNGVLTKRMGSHKPARCVSVSPELHYGVVEIEAIAEDPKSR